MSLRLTETEIHKAFDAIAESVESGETPAPQVAVMAINMCRTLVAEQLRTAELLERLLETSLRTQELIGELSASNHNLLSEVIREIRSQP